MSVNISVSGKTLKECHEQICALADEIKGTSVVNVITQAEPVSSIMDKVGHVNAPVQNVVKFPITPENPPQTAPVVKTDVEVDSRGLPWDARIHSSNKERGKDGVWRRRRGVDEAIEAQVEHELRSQGYGKTTPAAPTKTVPPFGSMSTEQYQSHVTQAPPKMPTTETIAKLPESANVLAAAQLPPAAPATFAPPPPALPPNTHNADSFRANLVVILNDMAVAGKINHQWINDQKQMFGGKDVVQWHENQAACAQLFEAFVGWGLINRL